MQPRHLLCITLMALCHLHIAGQELTKETPPSASVQMQVNPAAPGEDELPGDPGQEILPVARPESLPEEGTPIRWEAQRQTRTGDTWMLDGDVTVYYTAYVLHARRVVFHESTTIVEVEGPLRLDGGQEDIHLTATGGEINVHQHTARFYHVDGSMGVRSAGRTTVFTTNNPFRFSGRVLMQDGPNAYRILDGSMTNCRIPHPDWQLISHVIELKDQVASTQNTSFRLFGVPLFYLPYLRHPVEASARESGFLVPVIGNSTTRGVIVGEQLYVVLGRSMDMVLGAEYYSQRGWAPNGDFRYKGNGDDHLQARWNALLDRGLRQTTTSGSTTKTTYINQGGSDVAAQGRKDLTQYTHVGGITEYLSSYAYRLAFAEDFSLAVTSQVGSYVAVTHAKNGIVPSASLERFENFSSSTTGHEVRLLHLPSLRFDVLNRPLFSSPLYGSLGSSAAMMDRSEPSFHARNLVRLDFYPHLWLPLQAGGWSFTPEVAVRDTFYSRSETPDTTGKNGWVPYIRMSPLNRTDFEGSASLRAPTLLRDFHFPGSARLLRHVIEPELHYRYVGGIDNRPVNIVRNGITDIATDTNEVGYTLVQRLYVKPLHPAVCPEGADAEEQARCSASPREWASWEISQKYFLDPTFDGALIRNQRNVFSSTLDLTGVSFLNGPRNISPVTSRLRFEAIHNMRIEWDLDYDSKAGNMTSDNVFAGYSFDRATIGVGHSLLNAVNEHRGGASTIKSQILQPFLNIGRASGAGFNLAANAGYDFVLNQIQYNGIQASYNWNCCGLSFGYRRFQLGTLRDETQYLYSFTIANFGSVGDIRHNNTVFNDPSKAPLY